MHFCNAIFYSHAYMLLKSNVLYFYVFSLLHTCICIRYSVCIEPGSTGMRIFYTSHTHRHRHTHTHIHISIYTHGHTGIYIRTHICRALFVFFENAFFHSCFFSLSLSFFLSFFISISLPASSSIPPAAVLFIAMLSHLCLIAFK